MEWFEGADIVTAGFPCQDISYAGEGAGLSGERSGVGWWQTRRTIRMVRPLYALLENVAALLNRGMGTVLGSLAQIGYDAEWHCIPASAVGAPHIRDRVWIVAHTEGERCGEAREPETRSEERTSDAGAACSSMADTPGTVSKQPRTVQSWSQNGFANCCPEVPNAEGQRVQGQRAGREQEPLAYALERLLVRCREGAGKAQWQTEPDLGRVVTRLPNRMDGGRLDGKTSNEGTNEILQDLRKGVRETAVQWPSGGHGAFSKKEALLKEVCQYKGAPKALGNASLESKEAQRLIMRGVWFDGEATCSSCRRSSEEQLSRKHPDTLRVLSQLLTCDCGSAWLDDTGAASNSSRAHRIKALGNSVVPQIPELIGYAIAEREYGKELVYDCFNCDDNVSHTKKGDR